MKIYFLFILVGFSSIVFGQSGFNPPKTKIAEPLKVENIGIDTVRVLDSVRVHFENVGLDTSNQGILKDIYDVLSDSLKTNITITNDSLKVWFSQPIETKSDTANKSILEAIYNVLVDSLADIEYNINETFDINNSTVVFPGNTIHSYTIIGITGTYDLTEVSSILAIPAGVTQTSTADGYLQNDVTVFTTGRVIIKTIR